jgi:hypothetical protein
LLEEDEPREEKIVFLKEKKKKKRPNYLDEVPLLEEMLQGTRLNINKSNKTKKSRSCFNKKKKVHLAANKLMPRVMPRGKRIKIKRE